MTTEKDCSLGDAEKLLADLASEYRWICVNHPASVRRHLPLIDAETYLTERKASHE